MDTLLLSAHYQPLQSVPWQRALGLLCAGRVEVIEDYADRTVRSARSVHPVPAVIRFLKGARWRSGKVTFCKRNVHARDDGRCQYCRKAVPLDQATYDHVVPRAQGGKTVWSNIVIACLPCNQRKGSRTPRQAGLVLARAPKRPKALPRRWVGPTWAHGMPPIWQPYLH